MPFSDEFLVHRRRGTQPFGGPPPQSSVPTLGFDFFVSQSLGNDSWNGLFPTHQGGLNGPKQTVVAGLGLLTPGTSLGIRTGTYNEILLNNVPSGTGPLAKVTIGNYGGEVVTLFRNDQHVLFLNQSQQYIDFNGINFAGELNSVVALIHNTHHIRMMNASMTANHTFPNPDQTILSAYGSNCEYINLTITGRSSTYAIYVQGNNNIIDGCVMEAVSTGGVHCFWTSGTPTGNIIRNCIIRNITTSQKDGIPGGACFGVLLSGNNNQAYNNLVYGIDIAGFSETGAGINVFTGTGNKVWNNTVANNPGTVNCVKLDSGVQSTEIRNNLAWNNGATEFVNNSGNNTHTVTDNSWQDIPGQDPQFVDQGANNFALQITSPAINTGITVGTVTNDFIGTSRPQGIAYDIGAYEFIGAPFNYYLSTTGDNNWNGLFPSHIGGLNGPKRTFGGAQGALALLQPGQTLGVRGGFYDEQLHNPTIASGINTNQRTRIVNYPGETPWIRPSAMHVTNQQGVFTLDGAPYAFIEFDGINLDARQPNFFQGCLGLIARATGDVHDVRWKNAEMVSRNGVHVIGNVFSGPDGALGAQVNDFAHNHEFINLNVHGGGMNDGPNPLDQGRFQHQFYAFGVGLLIQNCTVWDFVGCGFHLFRSSSGPKATGIRIIGNTLHTARATGEPNPLHCGILDDQDGTLMYNNVVYNMRCPTDLSLASGIALGGTNAQCYFNTVVNCDQLLTNFGNGPGNVFRNNLGWQNFAQEGMPGGGFPTTQSNNMFGTTNPQFVNPGAGNYDIQAITPASIRTGGLTIAGITTDKDGVTRPNPPSIGAYQA